MRSIVILAGLIGLSTSTGVMAEDHDDKVATTIAQSWIGHDASELLTQWPVDSGFNTFEIQKSNETAYSYNFGMRAHTDTYSVSDGVEAVGSDGQGGAILLEKYHTEQQYVPQKIECDVTFFADVEGIITRYEYSGLNCRSNFRHWGKPKSYL